MPIPVTEALARLEGAIVPGPVEHVPLAEACGRVLRNPVRATRALPPFDRVMMDGIAVSSTAWAAGRRTFRLGGRVHAGAPAPALADPEECIVVMTGAVCPAGADVVVPREAVTWTRETAAVDPVFNPPPGGYIHRRGSDAGEGAELLAPGIVLGGPALGIVASTGRAEIAVARRPRLALVSTGDELVEPGVAAEPHQIVRSNPFALRALLAGHAVAEFREAHLPDEVEALREGLRTLLEGCDWLVCSGGVSQGDRDFLPMVLAELGVRPLLHGVAQRPGKPLWVGRAGSGKLVFALPGNPVSTLVCARRYLVPALERWLGQTAAPEEAVELGEGIERDPALTRFVPVAKDGSRVRPVAVGNSGDFVHLAGSAGFVEVAPGGGECAAGTPVPFFPW